MKQPRPGPGLRFGSEFLATDKLRQALPLLQKIHSDISLACATPECFGMRMQMDFLDEIVLCQIELDSDLECTLHTPYDGYLLIEARLGGLLLSPGEQQFTAPFTVMIDALGHTRWRWRKGSYQLIFIKAEPLHTRLAKFLDKPIMRRIQFERQLHASALEIRFAQQLLRASRVYIAAKPCGTALGPRDDASRHIQLKTLRNVQDAILHVVLSGLTHNYTPDLNGIAHHLSPRHVRRAIEYMREKATQPITLEDLAEASNVSIRTLQAGFARFKGLSPMAYLKQLRLDAVHMALQQPQEQRCIAEIAQHWQFSHMGQFASDYRKAFGCSPSQTRSAAQLRQAAAPSDATAVAGIAAALDFPAAAGFPTTSGGPYTGGLVLTQGGQHV